MRTSRLPSIQLHEARLPDAEQTEFLESCCRSGRLLPEARPPYAAFRESCRVVSAIPKQLGSGEGPPGAASSIQVKHFMSRCPEPALLPQVCSYGRQASDAKASGRCRDSVPIQASSLRFPTHCRIFCKTQESQLLPCGTWLQGTPGTLHSRVSAEC